jgi:polysaccharide export outer membrane protein
MSVVIAAWLGLSSGCDIDSYADPAEIGRHENTPVMLPILKRIDVIEEPEQVMPGLSDIQASDLIPEVTEYVLGPGDLVTVTVFELLTAGIESVQTRRVDELGFIRLPVIGQIKAGGLTTKQLEQAIINVLHPNILQDPMVTVIVQEGRQKTFSIIGAVGGVGTYTILKSNFRLLDAIALARGIPTDTETIYVIRQVPLSDLVEGRQFGEQARPGQHAPPLRPADGTGSEDAGSPILDDPGAVIEDLLEDDGEEPGDDDEPVDPANDNLNQAAPSDAGQSPADLGAALESGEQRTGRWMNVGGKWVQVIGQQPDAATPDIDTERAVPDPDELVTQRIIEIDALELQKGIARYNIVVRPGDVIRVPGRRTGNIFIGGHVARPGTYALPGEDMLTLRQAIISAGGLGALAIPERVDLTRRIGKDHEATVRLNLRAIEEGVQPNIFLKRDDTIRVGTNAWAAPLAVTRNAFRMTYGFGFLLDRNFGTQVFGRIDDN